MINLDLLQSFIVDSYKNTPVSSCKVVGNSMFPLMRKDDWVIVEPIVGNNIRVAEIILFHNQDRFVVHRIVRINGDFLITKGDWSITIDPPVHLNYVVGRVVAIRKGKWKISLSSPILIALRLLIHTINLIIIGVLHE